MAETYLEHGFLLGLRSVRCTLVSLSLAKETVAAGMFSAVIYAGVGLEEDAQSQGYPYKVNICYQLVAPHNPTQLTAQWYCRASDHRVMIFYL